MDTAHFRRWLNLPSGWRCTIGNTGNATTATLTAFDGTSHTYRVIQHDGKYVLEDSRNLHGVSDNANGRDASEFNESVTTADAALPPDSLTNELRDRFKLTAEQAAGVASWHRTDKSDRAGDIGRIVGLLLARHSPGPSAWGLAFASGLDCVAGRSMTAVAALLGCTRALVSKEANYWTDTLALPRSRYQKSHRARVRYSKAQRHRQRE